jgi:hypothetical protein
LTPHCVADVSAFNKTEDPDKREIAARLIA